MKPGDTVPVTVTFLEMRAPPAGPPLPPAPAGAEATREERPSVAFYRELYDAVGREWHWVDRKRLGAGELGAILGDPAVEVHVLRVEGEVAGFAELDRRTPGEVRLAYFGLLPAFIGRGLGWWFLRWAVQRAWSYAPERVWVDTCTLDHPRALALYEAAGFRAYDTLEKRFTIPS